MTANTKKTVSKKTTQPKKVIVPKESNFDKWWNDRGLRLLANGHVGANILRHAVAASDSKTNFDDFYSDNIDLCNSQVNIKELAQSAYEA